MPLLVFHRLLHNSCGRIVRDPTDCTPAPAHQETNALLEPSAAATSSTVNLCRRRGQHAAQAQAVGTSRTPLQVAVQCCLMENGCKRTAWIQAMGGYFQGRGNRCMGEVVTSAPWVSATHIDVQQLHANSSKAVPLLANTHQPSMPCRPPCSAAADSCCCQMGSLDIRVGSPVCQDAALKPPPASPRVFGLPDDIQLPVVLGHDLI